MIYSVINTVGAFRDVMYKAGRGEQYTYQGAVHLFEYLSAVEDDIEMDPIAICCQFAEEDLDYFARNRGFSTEETEELLDSDASVEDVQALLERLCDRETIIQVYDFNGSRYVLYSE